MTATNHTEHYDLSQYTEDDRPTFTGDYNGDMSKIDAAIYAASQSGGLTAVAHDDTLTGDGTGGTPLGIVNGLNFSSFNTELTWGRPLSEVNKPGLYRIKGNPQNSPDSDLPDFIKDRTQVTAVLLVYKNSTSFIRIIYVEYADTPSGGELTLRCFGKTYTPSSSSEWFDLNPGGSDIPAPISHDATLTGDGTDSSPLGVADAIARTESVTQAIASAIADRLTAGDIKAGDGINIETSGNQVTISYVGGGSSGGLNAVVHDNTLTGDGTSGSPLGMIGGNFINAISKSGDEADANKLTTNRIYKVGKNWKNMPPGVNIAGGSLLDASYGSAHIQCILSYTDGRGASIFVRQGWGSLAGTSWERLAKASELSSYVQLSTYNALVNRVAALESQVAALTTAAAPAATGSTAEQLDSQYSDGYNIIKVGAPIHGNESEESSQ